MRPKQIIIDKDVFHGTNHSTLCKFTKNHLLILPDVLLYECLTTQKNKDQMLSRCRQMVLAGARVCPSLKTIVQAEAADLDPYGSLVNREWNHALRETFVTDASPYDLKVIERRCKEDRLFVHHLQQTINGALSHFEIQESNLLGEVRKCDSSNVGRTERLVKWADFIDSQDIHHVSEKMLKGITNRPEEFCLSNEWVSWDILRVFWIWMLEINFSRQTGGEIGERNLEHDWQDIAYVSLLSRADGLLTKDKKLVKPLAKAAFPDKDVFSSLDEVPEDYVCNWT